MCSLSTFFIVALFSAPCAVKPAAGSEIITGFVKPVWTALEDEFDFEYDETRALDVKSEQFWQPVLKSAEEAKLEQHAALYKDAENVIAELPAKNSYVREALQEAMTQLHHADDMLAEQAAASSEIAIEKLSSPAGGLEDGSFVSGPQKLLSLAMSALRHALGLTYRERLHEQVQQRQADILPALRGAAKATRNVLTETREASKKGYDVLKYDLYEKGAPKTPEAAKKVAQRIVDAANEDRHKFLQPIVASVDGLARDVREEKELPSATVNHAVESGLAMESEMQDLSHHSTLEA